MVTDWECVLLVDAQAFRDARAFRLRYPGTDVCCWQTEECSGKGTRMLLVIDANVIVANPLLRGAQWEAIARAVCTASLVVAVPELAIDEAVARYRENNSSQRRALRKQRHQWPGPARDALDAAIAASEKFADDYPRLLGERLAEMSAKILAYPEMNHRDLAGRAITRQAPFDADGGGYRDALH